MPNYTTQIQRIKEKFAQAKEVDREFKVFGASHHKYQLGRTVTEAEVSDFETRYNISLPECYRAFITEFAGISAVEPIKDKDEYIPAPNYGLFSFDRIFDEVEGIYDYKKYTQEPSYIDPCMGWCAWNQIDNENVDEFLYGLLPIGYEDCEGHYYIFLILNGEYKGKVVYGDLNTITLITHEDNFLDWYERWFDMLLNGTLQNDGMDFAYFMRGNEEELLEKLANSSDSCMQYRILDSLKKFNTLKSSSINQLAQYFDAKNKHIYCKVVELIAQYSNGDLEVEELKDMINSKNNMMCIEACSIINNYKIDKVYWKDILIQRLQSVKSIDILESILDTLDKINYNYFDEVLPLLEEADSYKKEVIYDKIDKFPNKPFALTLKIKWHRFIRFFKDIFIVATMLIIGVLYFSIWILIMLPFEYISLIFKKLGRSKDE